MGFLILSNIVLSLVWILQCNPVDAAWDCEKRQTAKCFTQGQVQRVIMSQASKLLVRVVPVCCCSCVSVISIISDFVLAGFPIIILRNVRINRRQKILLCGLMGLGLL